MKNTLIIFQIFIFCFFIISCAKEDGSSSSSVSTMSTPAMDDGTYKLTATTQKVYYSNGTLFGSYTYVVSHDSSVTPGYLAYVLEWKGSGVYRVTSKGKATLSASGLDDTIIDCTTNGIDDVTLDTDGNVINSTVIQTGCGGSSSSLEDVSDKLTAISGGFTHYAVLKDSDSNEYQVTYTFQKQSTSSSSTTELEGTWKSSCINTGSKYRIKTITVSGTNFTDQWKYHSDSNCTTDEYSYDTTYTSLSIGNAITFEGGKTGHKLTMTVDTNTYTPLSSSDVTWDNNNSWCGETDWVLNTAQSIAGKTCGSSTEWNTNITIYGAYALDGSKLYMGLASGSYPSTVAISDNASYTKQ